jgi:hypothetical protein
MLRAEEEIGDDIGGEIPGDRRRISSYHATNVLLRLGGLGGWQERIITVQCEGRKGCPLYMMALPIAYHYGWRHVL